MYCRLPCVIDELCKLVLFICWLPPDDCWGSTTCDEEGVVGRRYCSTRRRQRRKSPTRRRGGCRNELHLLPTRAANMHKNVIYLAVFLLLAISLMDGRWEQIGQRDWTDPEWK